MSESAIPPPTESDGDSQFFVLSLYITGASHHSARAITNLNHICETYLPGQYSLEVIDVYQQKEIAQQEQLFALPLLIKRLPLPERRLIGDLSDTRQVLKGLGLLPDLE
ncbi:MULTISPECIES: circadian clock KaiB family protein [Spirosoma]|uniref:Circadian clock protein KaiB n=1 Tax=Spirosoma sordidisoli TaxID=2502893 RepID=A0A4Q2UI60_9BACT|nr:MULTISPECIES: circadian clock KaiB family protein [Spirosoma]RYC67171.1 circadian clock protein KaiB [Spirosoma sordidisoli]